VDSDNTENNIDDIVLEYIELVLGSREYMENNRDNITNNRISRTKYTMENKKIYSIFSDKSYRDIDTSIDNTIDREF
jgi:hypothetical protein